MTEQQKRMFVKQWQWRNNYYPKQHRHVSRTRALLVCGALIAVVWAAVVAVTGR